MRSEAIKFEERVMQLLYFANVRKTDRSMIKVCFQPLLRTWFLRIGLSLPSSRLLTSNSV